MTKKEQMAKEALERKIESLRKHQEYKSKEDFEQSVEQISSQIRLAGQVNLINRMMVNKYLEDVRQIREQYEEQKRREDASDELFSMNEWKREIERKNSSSNASSNNEREEIDHDKQMERDEEKDWKKELDLL